MLGQAGEGASIRQTEGMAEDKGDRMKRAILRIHWEVLRELLQLPPEVDLIDARCDAECDGVLLLKVRGFGCETHYDGAQIMHIKAEITSRKTIDLDWGKDAK